MPEKAPYQLSLGNAQEPFRPEIEYVCDVLETWYPIRRSEGSGPVLHYGTQPPEGAIHVPAYLFPDCVKLGEDGISPDRASLDAVFDKIFPPKSARPQGGRFGFDVIGLIFLMLSRLEERDYSGGDRYGRFAADDALARRCGCSDEPVVDVAADDIAEAILGQSPPPRTTKYEVLLTHDVDQLRGYHRWYLPARHALGDVISRARPDRAIARLRNAYLTNEPFRSIRALMDLAERHGLAGRYYFMGPTRDPMDSPYAIVMQPTLKRLVREIRERGHVIGFHPGFGTARNQDLWLAQKNGLESIIETTLSEGRQHVLDYQAEVTPDIWDSGRMALDATLAFPETSEFRAGTCRRFPAFSLRRRKRLALTQVCTPVMDFSLFGGKYRDVTMEEALREGGRAAEACRRFGGSLVLLYHSGQVRNQGLANYFDTLLVEVVQ